MATQYSVAGYSLYDFIKEECRTEEILVPREVAPQHLLGYWSRGVWHPWAQPDSRGIAARLEKMVTFWRERPEYHLPIDRW
jgi:hypothetical protein